MKININQGLKLPLRRLAEILALVATTAASTATPAIEITSVPPYGSCDRLQGRVTNADPATHAVVVFIYIPCVYWWSKPVCNPALTPIRADGTWSCSVATGGIDNLATNFCAMLVSTGYTGPCVLGLPALPPAVTSQAIAIQYVSREPVFPRRISFSGYEFHVKLSPCLTIGPGPCYYGDGTDQVWLDASNRLHLRISYSNSRWRSAEVISMRRFGYGRYVIYLDTPIDALDANAVWGCFTYGDMPCNTWREIDFLEATRWGNPNDSNNCQFVVQPWNVAGHRERFRVPPTVAKTTHVCVWDTDRVTFQTFAGHSTNDADLIREWTCTNAIPVPGDDTLRMNLYLADNKPPFNGQPVEVVISRFEWRPLLKNWRYGEGTFEFTILGQAGQIYEVQTSDDLQNWTTQDTVSATSAAMLYRDTNAAARTKQFYRVLPVP
ncbi:MAG: hypothetical protein NTW21_37140 [Verrucomicrobia bacterium]|nr:hypothetical protein [Verrucomicrobiota bacterium]